MTWPMYGYAFARLAEARSELKPAWINHLREDTKVYFKQARKWLKARGAAEKADLK